MLMIVSLILISGVVIDIILVGFNIVNALCAVCGVLLLLIVLSGMKTLKRSTKIAAFRLICGIIIASAAAYVVSSPVSGSNSGNSVVKKADALMDAGQQEKAYDLLWEHIAKNPDDVAAVNQLGLLYEEHGSPIEAKKMFESAFAKAPDNKAAGLNLCRMQLVARNYNAAVETAEIMLLSYPRDKEVLFLLSDAYLGSGDSIRGIYYANMAVTYEPDLWNTHLMLGDAYLSCCDFEMARYEYDLAQELAVEYEQYEPVRAAQDKLRKKLME